MLGIIICSDSGKCSVTQPRFAASLNWIAATDHKRDRRDCVDMHQIAATKKKQFQRTFWWEVSSSNSNTQLLRARNTGYGFLLKGSYHLSKCPRGGHYQLIGIGFGRNKNIFYSASSLFCMWELRTLWSGRFSNLSTCSWHINIKTDSFLSFHSQAVCWEHLECKYTCQLLLSIAFSLNDMHTPRQKNYLQ